MTRRRAFNVRSACKPLAMTCLALVFAMLSSGVFAGNANIPQLYITIPAADFDAVCDAEAVWGPIWTKEYVEKGCTIRMRYPGDSSDRFNVNCGLRNHGGGAAHGQAKRSFRLKFRGPEYGVKRLNYPILERAPLHANSKQGFDNLVLRGGGNENSSANSELTLTYMRDEWVRATQIDMSGFGNHGTFVNLYVNGQYWGLYNMTERADRAWGQMWFGGTKGDWASWRDGDPRSDPPRPPEGDQTRYNTAKSKCKNAANLSLSELRNYINPEAFADYMILGFFTGASDWKCANTWAVTRNSPAGLTYWTWWDAEFAFEGGDNYSHRIKTDEAEWWVDGSYAAKLYGEKHDFLQFFYDGLIKNAEFKQVFSDRARLHLTGTGALTDAKCKARWDALKNFIAGDVAADRTRWSAPKAWNPDHIRNRMTGNADAAFNAFDAKGWILYGGLPDAPSAVTANAVSETRVNLTWQDNSDDEDGFKIDRRISGGSEWVRIATPSANVEAASDTGVTAGTTYSYKIKAYNAAGSGAYSATASVTTPGSAPSPPSIPGLVARWAFDEGSGTVADDSSGHGYNGTLVGGPKWTSGKYGTALDFDGVDDYVHVPGHALHFPTGNSPRTVCGWFEADAAHTEYKRQFFGYGSWEYGYGKAFTCLAATKYIAIAFNGTRTEKTGVSVGAGWHHVAFVVPDGATKTDQVRFYLDGNLLTGYTATGNGAQTLNTYVDPNQANAEIAWFNEGKRDGKLDDIRIYNRALSAAE
ncbi:MAG: CotH kinase family protein, partial [Kiritimatiellae bacterium]|nr:CotH kinase family protein [Kiritimatiellia bacterium]